MKERPIIFSGEMVRAILERRKTQTRRVIKPQPLSEISYRDYCAVVDGKKIFCPYGQPGDRLWVKETLHRFDIDLHSTMIGATYDADLTAVIGQGPQGSWCGRALGWPWKHDTLPSIHMPRWASRITLEITGVKVERLQDITVGDAINEGFGRYGFPIDGFEMIWDRLNAKRGYVWDVNPWVWVIEFKKIETKGDQG